MRLVLKSIRFVRQLIEYSLVAAFFMGIPALAALGPRLRFLNHAGNAAHHRVLTLRALAPRSLVRRPLTDSLATIPPLRSAETGYTFGPTPHEESERPAAGR